MVDGPLLPPEQPGRPHHVPDPEPDPDVTDRHAVERARGGDDRAFAELIRAHDPDLHALAWFLVGSARAEVVLRIAYVKAYRALTRLSDDRPPRLWLHQSVLAAVVDELRRRSGGRGANRRGPPAAPAPRGPSQPASAAEDQQPDRTRSPHAASGVTVLGGAVPAPATAGQPGPAAAPEPGTAPRPAEVAASSGVPPLLAALDALPTEQRYAVALVDGVALTPTEAALVTDAVPTTLHDRLRKGRATLCASLALPAPAEQDAGADLAERFDALRVPAHSEGFWHEVGQHLLAARAAPVPAPVPAPAPEEAKRRATARVPVAPPARPRPEGVDPDAVRDLAGQARRRRSRDWSLARRVATGLVALAVVAALVVGGVIFSSKVAHRDSRLGLTASKVIGEINDALQSDAAVSGTATVSGSRTVVAPGSYTFVRAADGSYHVQSASPTWNEAYDAARGTFALLDPSASAQPVAVEESGLPTGGPDLTPAVGFGLGDPLASAVRLLSEGTNLALTTLGNNGSPQWVVDADLPSGTRFPRGQLPGVGAFADPTGADHVRVTFDESLRLPTQVQFTSQTVLVTTISFTNLEIASQRSATAFGVAFPQGTQVSRQDFGFQQVSSTTTDSLVGYPPVTPSYLPGGFTLAAVAARKDPPAGTGSTAGGKNPASSNVVSTVYRYGAAMVVITTRSAAAAPGQRWTDPFRTQGEEPHTTSVAIGDGTFYGVEAQRGDAPLPHLWGHDAKLVFTVAGDVSDDDLVHIAETLH